MPVLSGVISPASTTPGINSRLSSDGLTVAPAFSPFSVTNDAGRSISGSTVYKPNVSIPAKTTLSGVKAPSYFDDYYNRVHFSERVFALGNVSSAQFREFQVFNAYTTPQTLQGITAQNTEGIELNQPALPPLVYAPLQERTYSLSISTEGPPSVDATFTYVFDSGSFPIKITGSRVTAWVWSPDWSRPLIERMEWLTNVIGAYDGSEQRIALRSAPRKSYEFAFAVEGKERRKFENALYGWGARVWALPVWQDGEVLASGVSAGDLVIPCATASRDYHADGLAIIKTAANAFEVVEIQSVQANSVTLKRGLVSSWPAGSQLYPARTARLDSKQSVSRFTGDFAYGVASFYCVEPIKGTAATETTIYRGFPVMLERPEWSQDPQLDYMRKLAEFDPRTGARFLDDESGVPETVQSYRWALVGRTAIENFRRFLYARAGRCKAIWLPTWTNDMKVIGNPIAADQTALDIEPDGGQIYVDGGPLRRDIRIELANGSVYYRRVLSIVGFNASTDRVNIDTAFGFVLNPANIVSVSYMALARLDQDSVELAWSSGEFVEAVSAFRAMNNDV